MHSSFVFKRSETAIIMASEAPSWSCGACTMVNAADNTTCYICGTDRGYIVAQLAERAKAEEEWRKRCGDVLLWVL